MNRIAAQPGPRRAAIARRRRLRPLRPLVFSTAVLLIALVAACSDSGPAGPGDVPDLDFEPADQNLELLITHNQFFRVESDPSDGVNVKWYVGDDLDGEGDVFTFFPRAIGPDTVRAVVTAGDYHRTREWAIDVISSEDDRPQEVAGFIIENGPEPAEIVVRWVGIVESVFPMKDYLVGMSYVGPVSMDNWEEAEILETVPHDDSSEFTQYTRSYSLNPGARIWIAVRGRDETGQMSEITTPHDHLVTYPWWLGVSVQDEALQAVPQVILKWTANDVEYSGNTPTSGFLKIGPFRNIDAVELETQINHGDEIGDYYDYRDPALLAAEGDSLDITLIPRAGIDDECDLTYLAGEFLKLFRTLTRTDRTFIGRPNYCLMKWETYPLQVYVPEYVHEGGHDMSAITLDGIGSWNTLMGEEYFQIVESETEAQLVFSFPTDLGRYGLVTVIEPEGNPAEIIPQKATVEIDPGGSLDRDFYQMTVMHELGHALGIWEHSPCNESGHLMFNAVSSSLDDENGGIHPDERLTVRLIRYLPQLQDMSRYVLD